MNKSLLKNYSFRGAEGATKKRLPIWNGLKGAVKSPIGHFILFGIVLFVLCFASVEKILPRAWYGGILNTAIFSIASIGFCLLMGYSGLASLGTGGFIGIGTYAVYYVMTVSGLPLMLAILVAIAIAAVIGVIVGFISLRIESIYLVILTLGLSEILRNLYANVLKQTITLQGVIIFGEKLKTTEIMYLIIPVLILIMILTYNLLSSPTCRAMLAMKNSTAAAQAMGISLMKYRLLAFVICTIYASLCGCLWILRNTSTNATDGLGPYALITSLNILAAVIIGGYKSIWGAIFGTFVMYGMSSTILQQITFFQENPFLITIISGVLVIIVVMFYPGGLAQLLTELKYKVKGWRKKAKEKKYGKDIG